MREILFRAKRKDNGEWVEGLLWKKKYNTTKLFISCFPDKDDNEEVFVIDPKTIGQYTGLTDKNGNKVFENDIVKVVYQTSNYDIETEIKQVEYSEKECCYYPMRWAESCEICDYFTEIKSIEVIGNIIDNKELLDKPTDRRYYE